MILNIDSYPYIRAQKKTPWNPPSTIDYRQNAFMWRLRDFNDHDYWYCEIFQGTAFHDFKVETLIPPSVLRKIKTDEETFMYICNSHEAFLHIVEPLYNSLVVEAGIPPHKIILANEAADLYLEVKKYADANNLGYMRVEWVLEFEAIISEETRLFKLDPANCLVDKAYDKRYLNFNRRWRMHRPALVALLKASGLLEKGYVSIAPCDDKQSWEMVMPGIMHNHADDPELTQLLESIKDEIKTMPPLYLDHTDLITNRAHIEPESLYLYENSLVSIVSETTFYDLNFFKEARFLSEKTFKPIGYGHPFIIVSVPKSLDLLKSLGYKTFHPFIDENYDNEPNDSKRMKMILAEIKRISMFTPEEITEFIKNVKDITIHNHNLILSKSKNEQGKIDPKAIQQNFIYKTIS